MLNDAIEVDSRISFYQFILAVHDHEKLDDLICNISENYKEEAYWLKNLCKKPRDICIEEICGFSPETQIISWIFIFSEQRWDNIVAQYKNRCDIAPEAVKAFDFHYALALFNLRKENEAHSVLSEMYQKYHESRFALYDICAQLNQANKNYIYGNANREQNVKSHLNELHKYCDAHSISIEKLALGFVTSNPLIDKVLIGVDGIKQFEKNIAICNYCISDKDASFVSSIDVTEKNLLNPVNWN